MLKQRLKLIEEQQKKVAEQKNFKNELKLIMSNLERFISYIGSKLDHADWLTKRELIRTLVKSIEINHEDINIVFRINNLSPSNQESQRSLQYCWRGS